MSPDAKKKNSKGPGSIVNKVISCGCESEGNILYVTTLLCYKGINTLFLRKITLFIDWTQSKMIFTILLNRTPSLKPLRAEEFHSRAVGASKP